MAATIPEIVSRVPGMRRLLTPVNAGLDAGIGAVRHLLWYIEHHSRGPRQR